jgi:hypothetical protein
MEDCLSPAIEVSIMFVKTLVEERLYHLEQKKQPSIKSVGHREAKTDRLAHAFALLLEFHSSRQGYDR